MTKSRKLLAAALLLAGGYVAALVLGGLPALVLPTDESGAGESTSATWLSALKDWMPNRTSTDDAGKLVADPGSALSSVGNTTTNGTPNRQPTWLDVATDIPVPVPPLVANQPESADPPALTATSSVVSAAEISHSLQLSRSGPKARITDVRTPVAGPAERSAPPWDRWPRWIDDASAQTAGPVSATFQDLSSAAPKAMPVTYNDSEIVRRNSPPRDPGAAPSDALRTHVVIDGDTLSRLGERYLDDPEKGGEIYRLNRDVLTNPELLPIGVELRIPNREQNANVMAALPSTTGLAATSPGVSQAMVPVQWSPRPLADVPHAELLQPIPTGRSE